MRTLLNQKGVKNFIRSVEYENSSKDYFLKIGAEGMDALENFIKDTLTEWCENTRGRKRKILTKETCPIESVCNSG